MTTRNDLFWNDKAVSPVLGAILILAIGITVITNVQLNFVPVWNIQEELDHLEKMNEDFKGLKSSIEESAVSGTTLSVPLSMGFKYSPKFIVHNPVESAWAALKIEKDVWAEVRYNEMLPDGMDDATTIRNISTSTITYSLQGSQTFDSFIFEHGLITRNRSNYTGSAQTLIGSGTIYILGLNATEPEKISGIERRITNINPTSPAKNSVIGKNVWLKLRTQNVDSWKKSIENQGGKIMKRDYANGNIIAYFDSMVIRMAETTVTARSGKQPPRSLPWRLVRAGQQDANLPIGGVSAINIEVQDWYNNPVSNVPVNFSINTSSSLINNVGKSADLQSTLGITGFDGRASLMLKTTDAGFYYVDAWTKDIEKTAFRFSASSQGGVLKMVAGWPEITSTLNDWLGNPVIDTILFNVNDGTIDSYSKPTDPGTGNASTNLSNNDKGIRLTNISIPNATKNSAIVAWDTKNTITVTSRSGYVFNYIDIKGSVNSDGCVRYGTSPGSYPSIICDASITSTHSVPIGGLSPDTVYYFIVNSTRPGGKSAASSEYMFVTEPLTDTMPPASVSGLLNTTFEPLYIDWTWTDPIDPDFKHVEVYINGTFVANVTKGVQSYNASYLKPNSTYTISTRTVDTSDNINPIWINNTANTTSSFDYVFGTFLNSTGTVINIDNARNDSDGGLFALLEEEAAVQQGRVIKYTTGNPTFGSGSIRTGDYSNTLVSDNSYLNLREQGGGSNTLDSYWNSWQSVSEISNTSLASMNISIEAYVTNPEAVYIQLWDYPNNNWNATWHLLGMLPATDTVLWYNITNDWEIRRFVNGTGNYRIRFADAKIAVGTPDASRSDYFIDSFKVIFNYSFTNYRLNVTTNTTEIPDANTHTLQLRYNVSGDNFTMQIWDGAAWNNRTTLNNTTMDLKDITIQAQELRPDGTMTGGSVGNINKYYVLVRYVDENTGIAQGRLYLDYQGILSS